MNAAFLNEVVLESLGQDDLQAFESDLLPADAEAFEWQEEGSPGDYFGQFEEGDLYEGEFDDQEAGSPYYDQEWGGGYGPSSLTDAEVHELASSLMALETPAEAEEFLGSVLKSAKKGLAKFARPLVAKVAPLVGAGLGSIVPGVGTALGGMAGKALGSMIGGGGASPGQAPDIGNLLKQFLGSGGNPLAAILQSGMGNGLLGKLMGGQMEMADDAQAQFELARRTVLALDGMAQEMNGIDEGNYEFDRLASDAMLRSIREHLPAGIRPALIDTSRG